MSIKVNNEILLPSLVNIIVIQTKSINTELKFNATLKDLSSRLFNSVIELQKSDPIFLEFCIIDLYYDDQHILIKSQWNREDLNCEIPSYLDETV